MKVKYLLSKGFREKHKQNYNEQLRMEKANALRARRDGKIKRDSSVLRRIQKILKELLQNFLMH